MDIDLKGFHAVITGGSNGLGFEMSKALLSHNATVAIASRKGERLTKAYNTLKAEGFDVYALEMDVRDESSVEAAAKWVSDNWGRLDMLVNNAGLGMDAVNPDHAKAPLPFFEIQPKAFYNMVETNFIGYFLAARAFVPIMLRHGKGRLVNVSTGDATMVAPGMIPYGPSRAGAEAMSGIMSKEMKDHNIMVNALAPGGAANTGFVTDDMRTYINLDRLLPANCMNEAILFLASDKAEGVTGEKIIAVKLNEWLKEKGINWG